MKDFDLRKYLAENKLLKEEIMVDTTVMVDPNNTLMSNASDEEIDYIKTNITSVSEMSVENFKDIYDKYLNRFNYEADPLDLQIKALQIHIDKKALTREKAIEALAMLQGQDVEEFEDYFKEKFKLYTTNVKYDNGEDGYMYQLVDAKTGEENEIGFDQLYFIGKGDASDPQVFLDKDFKDFDQGSYQDEEVSAEEAMKIYNELK